MKKSRSSSGDDVAAAFKRACAEDDMEVAEHLLQALEKLADREYSAECALRDYAELVASLRLQSGH